MTIPLHRALGRCFEAKEMEKKIINLDFRLVHVHLITDKLDYL